MNKLKLYLETLTAENLKERVLATSKRFWLELVCVTLVAILGWIDMLPGGSYERQKTLGVLLGVLACGIVMDFPLVLLGENQKYKYTSIVARVLLWSGLFVCFTYWNWVDTDASLSFVLACLSVVGALVLMIPFGGYFGLVNSNDMPSYNLMVRLMLYWVLMGVVQGVLLAGGSVLMVAIEELFDCNISFAVSSGLCILSLWATACLFYFFVPSGDKLHDESTDKFGILHKGIQFVLLPMLMVYIIVILIYALRVLLSWELPVGTVSYLVSGVMFLYIFCYVGLYPKLLDKSSRLSRWMHLYIPMSMLPLLLLMSVGVIRRVSDYGITVERLYLITMLLWFYGVVITVMVKQSPRIRWIFMSTALLLLVTSAQPFNYTQICKWVHINQYEQMMQDNKLTAPRDTDEYQKTFNSLPVDVQEDIIEQQNYLRSQYDYEVE